MGHVGYVKLSNIMKIFEVGFMRVFHGEPGQTGKPLQTSGPRQTGEPRQNEPKVPSRVSCGGLGSMTIFGSVYNEPPTISSSFIYVFLEDIQRVSVFLPSMVEDLNPSFLGYGPFIP